MARRILVYLLAAALGLGALPCPPALALSLEEERKLGQQAYQEVVNAIPMVTDPEVVDYIQKLGAKLVAHLPEKEFEYRFYVADSSEMNAFAIPGGYIFFYRGMITSLDNEAELAGIMAHEMGHVWRRHIAKRMDKALPGSVLSMAGMVTGILLGALAGAPQLGSAITFGSMAGNIQQQLAFSRTDEAEADWAGHKIMTAAGYPGQEMAKTFRRMWRMEQQMGVNLPTYMRSHPQSPERMEAIENMVRRDPPYKGSYDNSRFEHVKIRLIALYDPPDTAADTLTAMAREKPGSPLPFYGQALLSMRKRDYDQALRILDEMERKWPGDKDAQKERGLCLVRVGRLDEAKSVLDAALTKDPGNPQILFAIGEAYAHSGQDDVAASAFRRVVRAQPENLEARRMLGTSLGRAGNLGEASLQLGLAFKQENNERLARYHLERAVSQLADRPELRQEAQKALNELNDPGEMEKRKRKPGPEQGEEDQRDPRAPWIGPGISGQRIAPRGF